MADWKHYMSSHFSSCTLLARARDHHRERDVRIYVIPGVGDAVGISDGTDCWIAPASAECFSVNVRRLLDDLHAGRGISAEALAGPKKRERRALLSTDDPPAPPDRPRRRLEADPAPIPSTIAPSALRRRRED